MSEHDDMSFDPPNAARIRQRLQSLYPDDVDATHSRINELMARYGRIRNGSLWSERDCVLITYGDQVRAGGERPLQTLRRFLTSRSLTDLLSTVHILPFFPYSSDDGFSVIDYRQVDPALGTWDDVFALGQHVDLMFDLVLNHCSQQSEWFRGFVEDDPRYRDYFVTADPNADLSTVTRPRSTPLLTPYETAAGLRQVWTTFSTDQVDLNMANPDVLLEMLDVLLFYVQQGCRIIRLDAIAYLWKEVGTSCIHLPQTHEVVKLMRDVLEAVAPGVLLLTETNVPHQENVSYFGEGDEAHMVYQFSLAPLLLEAFLSGNAEPLCAWLAGLEPPRAGTTYFNFTASHDGVGVRPLEGLISPERFEHLVAAVQERGGLVSTKRNKDGSESPYELNVTYLSALGGEGVRSERHVRRFLSTQAIMLALQGIPGIYFHSLVGTPNFAEGVKQTGRARTINRRKFALSELEALLADDTAPAAPVLQGYRRMLAVRRSERAFHPDAAQTVIEPQGAAHLAFWRTSPDGTSRVLVIANCGPEETVFDVARAGIDGPVRDLLGDESFSGRHVPLPAWSVRWIKAVEQ